MHIRNRKDFWAGLLFAAFGLFFSGFGTRYTFGSAARMGPGYFPTVLGVLLVILGAAIALAALSPKAEEHHVAKFDWRTIALVLGSVVLFGVLLNFPLLAVFDHDGRVGGVPVLYLYVLLLWGLLVCLTGWLVRERKEE